VAAAQLDNQMLHGDLPCATLKLCDFGFSKNSDLQSTCKSMCGTPEYMAPEVLFEQQVCAGVL
jgi:serine/threonine protein kinase